MSDENTVTAGVRPLRTFKRLNTKSHTSKAVTSNVPMKAKNAAPLRVIV